MSGISTHILDTFSGRPAAGVSTKLTRSEAGAWLDIAVSKTDDDGRVKQLLPHGYVLAAGVYRISFATSDYFEAQKVVGLYPSIEIIFVVRDPSENYHVPLLLTANGYSTYRGS